MEAIHAFLIIILGVCHAKSVAAEIQTETMKTYIVHMANFQKPESIAEHTQWYESSLKSVSDSSELIYAYNTVVHGFATRLTHEKAEALSKQPGVISVVEETRYELHTTRTPQFLGISGQESLSSSSSGDEVIIGVLDTGVWTGSRSLDDTGYKTMSRNWKGICETGPNFNSSLCNRKLIGARFFSRGYEVAMGPMDEGKESKSPLDEDGHGTHTATTVAGSPVPSASLFGYAAGVARGMAPRARISAYKVCWIGGCFSSDILAAMDKAVEDGVDILSLSLGGGTGNYYKDSVSIGAFAAMERGILVSCSAGNSGPNKYTLSNVSPWVITVGAGTIDRDFPARVRLGDGRNLSGVSLYSGSEVLSGMTMTPLIYAGKASNATNGNLCMAGGLDPKPVTGKLVLCDRGVTARVLKGVVVKNAGGVGMILANTALNGEELVADAHLLPATAVGEKTGAAIKDYISRSSNPTAEIVFEGTKVGIQPSPVVAAFSSRGPNSITPWLLKPDLIAPGVNILAGWSPAVGPAGIAADKRRVEFNIISGTSMSCPHISGIAALLKSANPTWSPAVIQSALMTTAYTHTQSGDRIKDAATSSPSTPFDIGSGHVDPVKALDPGLVYDRTVDDYLDFFCALNYTAEQITTLARSNFTCDARKSYSVTNLNYPSFALPLDSGSSKTVVQFTRTVTNVGSPAKYDVSFYGFPAVVAVSVSPVSLVFTKVSEKKSYTVTFTASGMPEKTTSFGSIVWSDGKHKVSSPAAITWD